MIAALRRHWPEYLIEAGGLGIFMIVAAVCGTFIEHPGSWLREALPQAWLRRIVMGIAMGLTATLLINSPWGSRSGAHMNPAVTVTFWWLRKVRSWDAAFYVMAQFVGGAAGVWLAAGVVGAALAHPTVNYVVTVPGAPGAAIAFVAEFLMSFGLMLAVLVSSNQEKLAKWTGVFAGLLLMMYIGVEAPYSGMSINPARTVASALPADVWTAVWLYFAAPPLGMLAAAALYVSVPVWPEVFCAKLRHDVGRRCIFRCGYTSVWEEGPAPRATRI